MKFKIFKNKNIGAASSKSRNTYLYNYFNPARDWMISLCIGTTLFLFGIAYIGIDFYVQFGIPRKTVEIDAKQVVYQEKEVRMYAEQYAIKEKIFNTLREEGVKTVRGQIQEVQGSASDKINEKLADNDRDEYTSIEPTSP